VIATSASGPTATQIFFKPATSPLGGPSDFADIARQGPECAPKAAIPFRRLGNGLHRSKHASSEPYQIVAKDGKPDVEAFYLSRGRRR
jgi:hypothetical protein